MLLAVRGDKGIHIVNGPPSFGRCDGFTPDTAKNCKSMTFSNDGQQFAWCNGEALVVSRLDPASGKWIISWRSEEAKRTIYLAFSPKNTFLATWEVYAARNGETAQPNLRIWDASSGKLLKDFVQRKAEGWCPQWSMNESICCVRGSNNEAHFFTDNDFSKPSSRLSLAKMVSFSMSPVGVGAENTHHVVAFMPGLKDGGPAFGKLFAYPRFNPEKEVIATKSFFNVDKMDAEWSPDGKSVLLLCQSEVDKTGASYYGKTQLHYVDIRGETSMVQLPKDGPIYHLLWSPTTAEFCVVYGFMPAKATLFNKKCEPVFDFGTGPRNLAMFNPQGTILMLAGFGNLRGNIEMWDVASKREICKFDAPDTTTVEWSPDGQYIVTATCAPRLRMSNGYKVWHYTSTLMHEIHLPDKEPEKEELWEVKWQTIPRDKFPATFPILTKPIAGGVQPTQPVASKQAYRPPGARGTVSKFKLHDEDELPESKRPEGSAGGGSAAPSKAAMKNKKRREQKGKKENEPTSAGNEPPANNGQQVTGQQPLSNKKSAGSKTSGNSTGNGSTNNVDPELAKKIRKLNDKLVQISKLKDMQREGKQLELNQLEKIKKEKEVLDELRALRLNS